MIAKHILQLVLYYTSLGLTFVTLHQHITFLVCYTSLDISAYLIPHLRYIKNCNYIDITHVVVQQLCCSLDLAVGPIEIPHEWK